MGWTPLSNDMNEFLNGTQEQRDIACKRMLESYSNYKYKKPLWDLKHLIPSRTKSK